ncbi:MAG: XdhC/CoxI family protein [Vicinamibacterales bacterium]
MNHEIFAAIGEALTKGEEVALITIVASNGSTPQRVGAKMLVFADGRTVGTIGGGATSTTRSARRAKPCRPAGQRRSATTSTTTSPRRPAWCAAARWRSSSSRSKPRRRACVRCGTVGYYLARAASDAGFEVHVVDDRAAFANRERFPFAASVVVDDIPTWLAQAQLPPSAYAVIVTRGHRHDLDALAALAPRELRYLGLIGSRAKVARIYDQLLAANQATLEHLSRVHAPIGLDIGAVTPQEIAVSIAAELVAIRRGKASSISDASLRWMPKGKKGAEVQK